MNIPYTGSGKSASAKGMDKLISKSIWKDNNLVELHPFACLDEIDNNLLDYNLAFSPKDSATLWNCIEKEFNKKYNDFEDEKYNDIEDMVERLMLKI